MKKTVVFIAIIVTSNLLAGNYANWQEHSLAFLNSQQQPNESLLGTTVVTVGSDNSCDFRIGTTKIQDAIDSGVDEVRIATETYFENLEIDDFSVNLIGGFADCDDAANDINNGSRATVDGGGNGSVLYLSGNAQNHTVNIKNMLFTNGSGGDFPSGGGIAIKNADLTLNLSDVWLDNNMGGSGGGLHIAGGNTAVNASNVLIINNTASQGGGIFCSGNQNSILMTNFLVTAGIGLNEATFSDGGGALLTDGCDMTSYVGSTGGFLDFRGFVGNKAAGHGGGIAVKNGSRLSLLGSQFCVFPFGCTGNNQFPINVTNNTADSDDDNNGNGGGVYATGAGTSVDAITVDINNNKANSGGGFLIELGATLNTGNFEPNCWSPGSCNQIRNNEAESRGGGIYALSDAVVDIDVSHIQGNRAGYGTAGYIFDNATLNIKASMITGNGDQTNGGFGDRYVFRVLSDNFSDTTLKIQASTLADNNVNSAVLSNYNSKLTVLSSIIHNPDSGDVYTGNGGVIIEIFSCVMVNEMVSIPSGFDIVEDDPEFVNRLAGDFHLNPLTSPAVDFCNNVNNTNVLTDIDLEGRGWDDPEATNNNGAFDVGADESYGGDIIFENDFDG